LKVAKLESTRATPKRMIQPASAIRKVAFLGDYLPRKCGIATFTTDLRCAVAKEFPALQCLVVPVIDRADGYDYAMSDSDTSFATVSLDELLAAME
jgi:hypothetical protein